MFKKLNLLHKIESILISLYNDDYCHSQVIYKMLWKYRVRNGYTIVN